MPGINAIHSLPVNAPTVTSPAAPPPRSAAVQAAFEGAANVTRDAFEERPAPRIPPGACGCLRTAWDRIRNAVVHALPTRGAHVAPSRDPSPAGTASDDSNAPSSRASSIEFSRQSSVEAEAPPLQAEPEAPTSASAFEIQRQASVEFEDSVAHVQDLLEWAQSGGPPERRMLAYQRIQACLGDPHQRTLMLSGLALSAPPPDLPPDLQLLECSDNRLRQMPVLPDSLVLVDMSWNPLERWPALPHRGLWYVRAVGCGLTHVDGPLPDTLRILNLSGNHLTQLPEPLPDGLLRLHVERNLLTRLPAGLEDMELLQDVHVHGNPLDAETLARIQDRNARDIPPRFHLEPWEPRAAAALPSLEESERMDAMDPRRAFDQFIQRLKLAVDARHRPALARAIDAFRARVQAEPALFERLCAMAFGANASCEDRPILTWLTMLTAEQNAAMDAGRFDRDPGRLIDTLRHHQRVQAVDLTAAAIVDAQGATSDAVETYLHLRLAVSDLLMHGTGPLRGHFTNTANSGVTEAQIGQLRDRIGQLDSELREFAIASSSWRDMLRRTYPKAVAKAQERLEDFVADPDRYLKRVQAYLRAEYPGSEHDPEAQIHGGVAVMQRLEHAMWERLTARFERQYNVSLGG